jgi:hypothetical protein
MDANFSAVTLGVLLCALLTVALHARSLGMTQLWSRLALMCALSLAAASALCTLRDGWLANVAWAGLWLSVTGTTAFSAFALRRAALTREQPGAARLRVLALLSWLLTAFTAGQALLAVVDNTAAALVCAAGLFVAWVLTLGLSSLVIAQGHERRGHARAWLGHWLTLWSAAALLGPLAAMSGSRDTGWLGVLAALSLPLGAPFLTAGLLGRGPVPLDISGSERSAPNLATQRLALALLALLGFGAQGLLYSSHHVHCAGELVLVTAPANWRELPLLADGYEQLGPFTFRASHFDYKGYPSEYSSAALSDQTLCFSSTIPLDSWFAGDMYRSPADLRLRQSADGKTFIVTGAMNDERLLAAFQRRIAPRSEFDTPSARGTFLLGLGLCAIGSGLAAFAWRGTFGRAWQYLAFACFALSAVAALLYENHWAAAGTPKPGRELAVEHAWMI